MKDDAAKKNMLPVLAPLVLLAAAVTSCLYIHFFLHWNQTVYAVTVALLALAVWALGGVVCKLKGDKTGKAVGKGFIAVAVYLAASLSAVYLLNNVFLLGNKTAILVGACITTAVLFTLHSLLLRAYKRESGKQAAAAWLVPALFLCTLAAGVTSDVLLPMYYENYSKTQAPPVGTGVYTQEEAAFMDTAQFYISPDGNDENDGSFSAPFATIEKAKQAVRELDKTGRSGITVALMAGEYRVSGITFAAEDSGTEQCPVTYCAYGDGEVILNGGVTLSPDSFAAVTDEAMRARLSDEAKQKVVCTDLTKLGLTPADWGKLYAIGSYNTAAKYDGDFVGDLYCELFFNDTRMNLARYPDTGFLETGEVLRVGRGYESDGSLTKVENWDEIRNPESDIYKLDAGLAERIASWKTLDEVWMFGFWKYDWADASTPVGSFDRDALTLSPKFVSLYGAKEDAPYYFFNVFEELTAPGEWYLDRENGILYMYPTAELSSASIDLSLTMNNILKLDGAEHLTFRGLTLKGTRGDAVVVNGNNNTVNACLIKNIAGWAMKINGYNNTASENEITRTGMGGITLDGGDRATLTPGNNRADNNSIHDWSEIYQTYQPAVALYGVGNVCSHNEMRHSPHEAVTYGGNNHIIEYNLIHDVCLLTNDGGAIYAGRRWDWYGTVIRYNCIYGLGSGDFTPDGIYLDDALSGQTVYGNLLVNVPKFAIHLGGGRDLDVRNNIIVNCNIRSISYDDRAREGVINNGWFTHSSKQGGDMWQHLFNSPWQTDTWKEAYPAMTRFSDDFNDTDSPDFVPNPAYSTVTGNLVVNLKADIGGISDSAYHFSTIEGNALYKLNKLDEIFVDPANGDYSLKENSAVYALLPDFEEIPISEIGRY